MNKKVYYGEDIESLLESDRVVVMYSDLEKKLAEYRSIEDFEFYREEEK